MQTAKENWSGYTNIKVDFDTKKVTGDKQDIL